MCFWTVSSGGWLFLVRVLAKFLSVVGDEGFRWNLGKVPQGGAFLLYFLCHGEQLDEIVFGLFEGLEYFDIPQALVLTWFLASSSRPWNS